MSVRDQAKVGASSGWSVDALRGAHCRQCSVTEVLGKMNLTFLSPESILSMDIASTGPTSLRSNFTDETEEDDEDDSEDNKEDRFAKLTAPEELSQATLIRTGLSYT